jgi:hypothetical protein
MGKPTCSSCNFLFLFKQNNLELGASLNWKLKAKVEKKKKKEHHTTSKKLFF